VINTLVASLFQGCWCCGILNTLAAIGLDFADKVYGNLASGMTILVGLGLALWILVFAARLLLPFGPPPASGHWNAGAVKLFKCAVVLVFLRFSAFPEVIASITGVQTHVIYLFGPVAVLTAIASGSLRRVFRQGIAKFWLLFAVWMILGVPFSSWKGDSYSLVVNYLKADFVLLVTIAGLARKQRNHREKQGQTQRPRNLRKQLVAQCSDKRVKPGHRSSRGSGGFSPWAGTFKIS